MEGIQTGTAAPLDVTDNIWLLGYSHYDHTEELSELIWGKALCSRTLGHAVVPGIEPSINDLLAFVPRAPEHPHFETIGKCRYLRKLKSILNTQIKVFILKLSSKWQIV